MDGYFVLIELETIKEPFIAAWLPALYRFVASLSLPGSLQDLWRRLIGMGTVVFREYTFREYIFREYCFREDSFRDYLPSGSTSDWRRFERLIPGAEHFSCDIIQITFL